MACSDVVVGISVSAMTPTGEGWKVPTKPAVRRSKQSRGSDERKGEAVVARRSEDVSLTRTDARGEGEREEKDR